jgi:hypothetical protein
VHVAEHLSMGTTDPVGYALVLDAITHDGPGNPARISPSVCSRALMPGVNPLTLPLNGARVGAIRVRRRAAVKRIVCVRCPLLARDQARIRRAL